MVAPTTSRKLWFIGELKSPPCLKRDVLNGENEKPNRITEKGSIVYDGYAAFCIV